MKNAARSCSPLFVVAGLALVGCGSSSSSGAAGTASASAQPSASAPAPTASATPSATASAPPPEPPHECPPNSTGIGSFQKPCEAKGAQRLMDVQWTKTGDNGPSFRVTNKSKLVILYGKIAVYFYDKAGKQLPPNGTSGGAGMAPSDDLSGAKPKNYHTCSGSFFSGVMNPGEKAVLTFSCVPKSVVPDGTDKVEAEMMTVGFADSTGKKVDFYWRNSDLSPDTRAKGGVK